MNKLAFCLLLLASCALLPAKPAYQKYAGNVCAAAPQGITCSIIGPAQDELHFVIATPEVWEEYHSNINGSDGIIERWCLLGALRRQQLYFSWEITSTAGLRLRSQCDIEID